MKRYLERSMAAAAVVVLLLILVSLTGCSTLQAWVQDVPVWVIEKPANSLTKVYFVSEGVDPDGFEMTARQFAFEELLLDISEFLGYSTPEQYARELLQTGAIADLGLSVTEEFVREDAGGLKLNLLAEANRKTISKLVRDNLDTIKADEDKINEPENEAKAAYRGQNDYLAFQKYLEAALYAYTSPLAESKVRYEGLMRSAISVLEGLNLTNVASDPSKGSYTVQVTRGSGIFAPKISGLPIKVVFPIKNAAGKVRQQTMVVTTGNKGTAAIAPSHTGFRGAGVLSAYFDLEEELLLIEEAAGVNDEFLLRIRSIIAEKGLDFEFSITSAVAGSVIVVSFLDYEKNGSLSSSTVTMDSLISSLKADGIFVNRIEPSKDMEDEQKILAYARTTYKDSRSIVVIGSAGVSSIVESGGSQVVSVKGSARIYSLSDGSVFAETGTVAANAVGATAVDAKTAAFQRFGQVTASLIIGQLL